MTTLAPGTDSTSTKVSLRKHINKMGRSSGVRSGTSLVFTLPGCGALAATATAWRIGFVFAPSRNLIKPDILVLGLVRRFHLNGQVAYVEFGPQALVKRVEHRLVRCTLPYCHMSRQGVLTRADRPYVQVVHFSNTA